MNKKFFEHDARVVAKELLGMELVRKEGSKITRAMIVETEAYCGFQDRVSHSYKGQTKRNTPMFAGPGTIYVYLIYGMYHCLNFVTRPVNHPHAVLIRGIKILPNGPRIDGPGRLTRALSVTAKQNNQNIFTSKALSLGRRIVRPQKIRKTARIGIKYAGPDALKLWRYVLE